MKQMKYSLIIMLLLVMTACSVLNVNLFSDDTDAIPDSFTGIDSDLWADFVYLTNLPDCQLPCFWGLELGEDNMASVLDFLQETEFGRYYERQTIDDRDHETWITYNGYTLDFTGRGVSEIGDVDFFFAFDDETILRTITLRMRNSRLWLSDEDSPLLITSILSEFALMPTLLIDAPRNARITNFYLTLVYPERNFQINYRLDISEAYPLICLNPDNIRELDLYITNYPNRLIEESDTFIPIEGSWLVQGSTITTEEFIQFFQDNPDSCLDLTQYPQGE